MPNTTVWNILMILGRIIEQISAECRYMNDNFAYLPFLIMSPDPYYYFIFVSGP